MSNGGKTLFTGRSTGYLFRRILSSIPGDAPTIPLDLKTRYLQIAFNYDVGLVKRLLPTIVRGVLSQPRGSERILIEAGTPFIKREGIAGIRAIRSIWQGHVVADLKTVDGALGAV